MSIVVQTVQGTAGYRHQLDRARRFLARVEGQHANDVEFQDMMWAFYQNCWHVKDWMKHDPLASEAQKRAVKDKAESSDLLKVCQDLCNGTKHLKLDRPHSGAGAAHGHVDIRITPGESCTMDCMVEDGHGQLISGKQLAIDCVREWERILTSEGLAIASFYPQLEVQRDAQGTVSGAQVNTQATARASFSGRGTLTDKS